MEVLWDGIWRALDLSAIYARHPHAIDSLIMLVLFTGIAKVALGKRFEGRGGMAVIAATGVALTVGAVSLAHRNGFTLGGLGGTAWIILLIVLGLLVFDVLRSLGAPMTLAGGLASVLMVGTAASIGRGLDNLLVKTGLLPFVQFAGLIGLGGLVWWVATRTWTHGGPSPTKRGRTAEQPLHDAETASAEVETVIELEGSIEQLLTEMIELLRSGHDEAGLRQRLKIVQKRERLVASLYRRIIRVLARKRWKSGPDTARLPEQLRSSLAAAKDNISEFERLLEIAETGLETRNHDLLLGALERLLDLERHAKELLAELQRAIKAWERSYGESLLKRNV